MITTTIKKLICCGAVATLCGLNPLVQAEQEIAAVKFLNENERANQIPYFDNRFRIDAQVDEITLLFYRVDGAPPVILIRPDGSKLRINDFPKESVEWFDDRSFDMIKIKKPMPGPWQAVGQILPNSELMVVSQVNLTVEPLPQVLLAGETLKITGRLYNGELAIDQPSFRNVVHLDIDFVSTNNTEYENFGAEPVKLASFRDDGRGLDEYASDGLFTGEFELSFAPGEWQPVYSIKLPMATRELKQEKVVIQKAPVTVSVKTTNDEKGYHKVTFDIDKTYVDPDSVIFQGKIQFPDKQMDPFSISEGEGSGVTRTIDFGYTESGVHRLMTNVFGKTIHGRDFRLVLPEFVFNVEHQAVVLNENLTGNSDGVSPAVDVAKLLAEQAEKDKALLEELKQQQVMAAEQAQKQSLYIIIGSNIALLLIGAVALLIYRKRKNKG